MSSIVASGTGTPLAICVEGTCRAPLMICLMDPRVSPGLGPLEDLPHIPMAVCAPPYWSSTRVDSLYVIRTLVRFSLCIRFTVKAIC